MEEWQFYNRARLNALQEEETKIWEGLVERNDPATTTNVSKIVVLPPELMEEKQRLLADAFGDWTRLHYTNFVKASAKYGRKQHEKISEDIHKPVEEVVRYAKTFWEEGPNTFNPTEWERIMKQVEKGEKRLEEIDRLTEATGRLIGLFSDPWEELCFRNVNTQGRIFHSVEDRYLLCLTHLHGYGNWDRVRSSIRRCERFRFDYYLLSCSAETLGKRCEALMRMAEKELAEIDKKKGGAAAPGVFVDMGSTSSTGMRERLAELSKQIAEEAKRLAATRAELARAKGGASASPAVGKEPKAKKQGASTSEEPTVSKFFGRPPKTITEEQLPDLCRIIVKAGPDGIHKIVNEFIDMYPELSKRQVEKKVMDIAIKEKRTTDSTKVCYGRCNIGRFVVPKLYVVFRCGI
jgi:SWI/SNF-related matrix-associated actin-dependent regulator of chromatin subfamily A member 5